MTNKQAQGIFRQINKACFNSRLPLIPVTFKRMSRTQAGFFRSLFVNGRPGTEVFQKRAKILKDLRAKKRSFERTKEFQRVYPTKKSQEELFRKFEKRVDKMWPIPQIVVCDSILRTPFRLELVCSVVLHEMVHYEIWLDGKCRAHNVDSHGPLFKSRFKRAVKKFRRVFGISIIA
jgi:hypothetical protein